MEKSERGKFPLFTRRGKTFSYPTFLNWPMRRSCRGLPGNAGVRTSEKARASRTARTPAQESSERLEGGKRTEGRTEGYKIVRWQHKNPSDFNNNKQKYFTIIKYLFIVQFRVGVGGRQLPRPSRSSLLATLDSTSPRAEVAAEIEFCAKGNQMRTRDGLSWR